MEQQIAMFLQQVMEVTDRLRQNEGSSEQVRQLLEDNRTAGQMLEERMNRTEASVSDTSQAGGNSAASAQEAAVADDGQVGFGASAARHQPENFNGEDTGWRDWSRVFRIWAGRFQQGRVQELSGGTTWRWSCCDRVGSFDSKNGASAQLKSVAADFYHALILFCKRKSVENCPGPTTMGKDLRLGEYWSTSTSWPAKSWQRFCVRRLTATSLMPLPLSRGRSWCSKLRAARRSVIPWKFGCVIVVWAKKRMREHLSIATKSDNWTNFVWDIESISTSERPSLHRHRWSLMHFNDTFTSAGSTDTQRKNVGARAMEGQRSINGHNVEKHHGQCWVRSHTSSHKDSQKGGWKGNRTGNGKGTQKGGKRRWKEKVRERKDNVSTKSPNHQNSGTLGSWEQWSEQSWNAEADTATWRDDDWYTADSNSQTSAAVEEFNIASVGDLLSNLGLSNTSNLSNMNDWILHSEMSHLVLTPQDAKLLF